MRPTPEPAVVLALLRIAIAAIVLVSPEAEIARTVAGRDPALWVHPAGLGWLGTLVPLTPAAIAVASRVLTASAILVLVGAFTRIALVLLAASLLYVFGAAQLTGTVTHDMHLVWLTALLAAMPRGASPGDALSLAAWSRQDLAGPGATTASSWGIFVARLWLGLVYFFPGVQKLARGGLAWISAESLRGQMYFKWYEGGGVPPWPRIDRIGHLLDIAAGLVVAFELAMPLLVIFRRTRPLAIAFGLAFHLSAGRFLDVLFPSLMVCYVVLLPGELVRRRLARWSAAATPAVPVGRPITLAVTTAAFTLGIVVQGARGATQAYPFACYPTFAERAPDEIVDLAVDVVDDEGAGGEPRTFRLPRRRRQDEWGMVWRLAGLYGDPIDPSRLRSFARTIVPADATGAHLRWMIETYDTNPDAYGSPPRRRWPIHDEVSASAR